MSNNIGWCDCTINPVVGCTKCSPGCTNCYAERFAARLAKNPATAKKYAGVVDERGRWTGKINFGTSRNDNDMPHDAPGKNKRVFVGSMSDLFHPNVRDLTRDVIFASILCDLIRAKSKGHTFMILTKRAKEMCDYFSTGQSLVAHWWGGVEPEEEVTWPLPNLWVGVTVCNQEEADSKIPDLLSTPAAKRFISVEPMLGPIDLEAVSFKHSDGFFGSALRWHHLPHGSCSKDYPSLDWVICGGESGPCARPMHPDWVRNLRDQCVEADVPFYFKGWGGTKKTPALLDGREWREFPSNNYKENPMSDKQRTVAKIMCSHCKGTGTGQRGYEICPVCGGTGFIYDYEEVSKGKKMTGAELITRERQRQIEEKEYSPAYDARFNPDAWLAKAAACYALPEDCRRYIEFAYIPRPLPELWPWAYEAWKPTPDDRIRELVKAGALIAAEIDRLQAVQK